jgi:hypothetical protein
MTADSGSGSFHMRDSLDQTVMADDVDDHSMDFAELIKTLFPRRDVWRRRVPTHKPRERLASRRIAGSSRDPVNRAMLELGIARRRWNGRSATLN